MKSPARGLETKRLAIVITKSYDSTPCRMVRLGSKPPEPDRPLIGGLAKMKIESLVKIFQSVDLMATVHTRIFSSTLLPPPCPPWLPSVMCPCPLGLTATATARVSLNWVINSRLRTHNSQASAVLSYATFALIPYPFIPLIHPPSSGRRNIFA